ncbi:MAG: hypothetical protein ABR583_13380 [Gaiellaceae bacterium]
MRPERLTALARKLAGACPDELGREIAATGSVGAGLADEHSDLELLFLCDGVPTASDVRAWLESVGATEVLAGQEGSGTWAWCRLDGVEVEPYWGRADEARAEVEAIANAEALEHRRVAFAHVVANTLPLRTSGLFAELRRRLDPYPEPLARRLVEHAVSGWEIPSPRLGSALRNDRAVTESSLLNEAGRALRVVFALNRRWEPPRWKWLAHHAANLEIAPPRLAERVAASLVEPDAIAAVRLMAELVRDALALVPVRIDVESARIGTNARLEVLSRREGSS